MVAQHYRWDFVGLSTDTKPTPANSEKVVDGSTFYCSDTSKLYVFCKDTWYERKALGSGGGGTTYTAGSGIDIADNTISVDTDTIQEKLTAGTNVTISDNTISATDTTYSNFTGTDGTAVGTAGLVPAPATTDAGKFLKADGTWDSAGGGGITPVQTTGTSTTDVMSQDAITKMIFPDIANNPNKIAINSTFSSSSGLAINGDIETNRYNNIVIGTDPTNPAHVGSGGRDNNILIGNNSYTNKGSYNIALGYGAVGTGSINTSSNVAIGYSSNTGGYNHCVALGSEALCTRSGEVNIGTSGTNGYNSTEYRVIGGVHDGQDAHDAVTVGQVNAVIDAINTALNTSIPHIGS